MHPILHCLILAGISLIPLSIDLFHPTFPDYFKYLIIIIAFSLTFILYYYQFYKPFIKKRGDYLDLLISELLSVFDINIRRAMPQINNLRMSIMIVRKNYY